MEDLHSDRRIREPRYRHKQQMPEPRMALVFQVAEQIEDIRAVTRE